jgi:hypothetical protein
VHGVFLGFTLSMIMAHAPVILPAVLRVRLPYRPAMYAPALLLQASLLVRALAGDAWGVDAARRAGGVGNAVAVLLFIGVMVWSASARREPGRRGTEVRAADAAPPSPGPAPRPTLTVGAAR